MDTIIINTLSEIKEMQEFANEMAGFTQTKNEEKTQQTEIPPINSTTDRKNSHVQNHGSTATQSCKEGSDDSTKEHKALSDDPQTSEESLNSVNVHNDKSNQNCTAPIMQSTNELAQEQSTSSVTDDDSLHETGSINYFIPNISGKNDNNSSSLFTPQNSKRKYYVACAVAGLLVGAGTGFLIGGPQGAVIGAIIVLLCIAAYYGIAKSCCSTTFNDTHVTQQGSQPGLSKSP